VGIQLCMSEYGGYRSCCGWWLRYWHWNGNRGEGGDMVIHVEIFTKVQAGFNLVADCLSHLAHQTRSLSGRILLKG